MTNESNDEEILQPVLVYTDIYFKIHRLCCIKPITCIMLSETQMSSSEKAFIWK